MVRLPCRVARAVPAAALALALAASASACSGGDEPDQDPAPKGGTEAGREAPGPIETKVALGKVAGRLPAARRARLQAGVAEVVDRWLDAAYLGDFPRTDFSDAYPGFTKGAAADARKDAALMSNQTIGDRVDEVTAVRRGVVVDALAVRRRPAAATARFLFRMDLAGDLERTDRVSGRLFLTWRRGSWRVIGYDVQREVAR